MNFRRLVGQDPGAPLEILEINSSKFLSETAGEISSGIVIEIPGENSGVQPLRPENSYKDHAYESLWKKNLNGIL